MTTPLSLAIIGAGRIAGGYDNDRRVGESGIYSHAGAAKAQGGFGLESVFDPDQAKALAFQRAWNVGRVAGTWREILDGRHDVVSLCTPDPTHYLLLRDLIQAGCCRTIVAEKPLAASSAEIAELRDLAGAKGINLVCNFQRAFEPEHRRLAGRIAGDKSCLLAAGGIYMKGLHHIGVTLIAALISLCGHPEAVLTYRRVWAQGADEPSYDFVLFFGDLAVPIRSVDSSHHRYCYHLFELDLLFSDGRATLVDISQGLRESPVTEYVYSGVKILNEKEATYRQTGYDRSMVGLMDYVYAVTTGMIPHEVNTPESSYAVSLVLDRVVESYDRGCLKLDFGAEQWKK